MWAFAVVMISLVAMMALRLIAILTGYNRADKKERDKRIAEAKDALKTALKDSPDDINLHCALWDALQRVRKQK